MDNYSQYLRDPLDEEYLIIPGDEVEAGSLPPKEIELRSKLGALKWLYLEAGNLGVFSYLFKTKAYLAWEAKYNMEKKLAKDLIYSSRQHRAAYRRLVNSIPKDTKDFDRDFWGSIEIEEEKSA
ncbi:TPA: hypothetical protein IRP15_004879 [Escherichia coli O25b:H4-ST131]|uniref:hypothetical protein n=1 Tax=Escherichia coli TaxID=562 RepID=UPI000E34A0C9|nr:hypothetical protein [Escherichia coli]HAO9775438.1 hypothetical protein [Escherichia coli O25b:H4-ST131]